MLMKYTVAFRISLHLEERRKEDCFKTCKFLSNDYDREVTHMPSSSIVCALCQTEMNAPASFVYIFTYYKILTYT